MKVLDAEVYVVGNPGKNWVFLKLESDEGLSGISEATMGMNCRPIQQALHEYRDVYLGADPFAYEALWTRMMKRAYLPNNSIQICAINAVVTACRDLVGKALEVPVYQLIGGKVRERIRVYANGWYKAAREPAAMADKAREVLEKGYTALKFDPFGSAYHHLDNDELTLLETLR